MSSPECVAQVSNILGESPIWSPLDQRLYWLDIMAPAVFSFCPSRGEIRQYALPEPAGCLCLHQSEDADGTEGAAQDPQPRWLVAMQSGIHQTDSRFSSLQRLLELEPDKPRNRPNDGKCDRQGRFWVSTMSAHERAPSGSLYCIDNLHRPRRVLHRLTVPNSLAWSPDGTTMYFADTQERRILMYDYDIETGTPGNPRVFHSFDAQRGKPDGSTVDVDGCVWNAEVHAGRIVRYTPQGKIDRVIELPVSKVTSCAFGGPDMSTLFITSARENLTPEQLLDQPLAGALFAVTTGTAGIPETPARIQRFGPVIGPQPYSPA